MALDRTVQYADSGGLKIAYQVIGDGPIDVVMAFEWGSNLDLVWENPRIERFLRRFSDYGRLIHFDIRGAGLSDPVEDLPPLEEWVVDMQAVLSAVGSDRASLVGHGHAAQLCMLFAAMYPSQTDALVSINGYARFRRAPDYPWGYPPDAEESVISAISNGWGTGEVLRTINPCLGEGTFQEQWLGKMERAAGSPRRAALKQRMVFDVDIREVLPAITVPTLVLQTKGNTFAAVGHGQYLADQIPSASYVELPGSDHSPYASDDADALMEAVEEFLTGAKASPASDRALKTVVFTDIVDSTKLAAELGDRRWRSLLEVHESVALREVDAASGLLIKFTGDGLMATFDGPARAVNAIRKISQLLEPLGLLIRAGIHTGEVELIGADIGGIAVHIAARISALAGPGEILTSSTVRDLVAGSGLQFDDRGDHELKGVPETWRVLAVR